MSTEYGAEVVRDLELMVRQGLSSWDLPRDTEVSVLNLSENATFALKPPRGEDLVLRVHRVGYSSLEEIRSELAWIMALRREGAIDTARPVPARDGDLVQRLEPLSGRAARYAVAFERLPGTEPNPGSDGVSWFERLGEITARMHRHTKAWTLPPGFRRKRWDLDGMVGPRGYWGPWRAAMGLDRDGAEILEAALALIRRRLEAFGMGVERFGLVHADLRLANLLADGDTLRIIDFDDCGFSWFMYDFAAAVSFIERDPQLPALLDAWVRGYGRVTVLRREEIDVLPTFVALRRILLCAWLASHSEVPVARELGGAYTEATVTLAEELLRGRLLTSR